VATAADELVAQCLQFRPRVVAVPGEAQARSVRQALAAHGLRTEVRPAPRL
jgi:hypothetical protein